jgi:hypothetical protein
MSVKKQIGWFLTAAIVLILILGQALIPGRAQKQARVDIFPYVPSAAQKATKVKVGLPFPAWRALLSGGIGGVSINVTTPSLKIPTQTNFFQLVSQAQSLQIHAAQLITKYISLAPVKFSSANEHFTLQGSVSLTTLNDTLGNIFTIQTGVVDNAIPLIDGSGQAVYLHLLAADGGKSLIAFVSSGSAKTTGQGFLLLHDAHMNAKSVRITWAGQAWTVTVQGKVS